MSTGEIHRFPPHPPQGGITLVETMTTLAVASILLTAAIPPMQDFVIRTRMSVEVNNFVASLYLARSEAVKRLQDVSLCPTTNGASCDTSTDFDWSKGWMVYADRDNSNTFSNGDVVLQRNAKMPFKNDAGHTKFITFNPRGSSNAGSFTFSDDDGIAETRCVTGSPDGRSYVSSGACS